MDELERQRVVYLAEQHYDRTHAPHSRGRVFAAWLVMAGAFGELLKLFR